MSLTTVHKNSYLTRPNQALFANYSVAQQGAIITVLKVQYMYVCWPLGMQSHVHVHTHLYYCLLIWGIAKWREALYSTNMLSVTTRHVPIKNICIHNTPRHAVCCTTRQSDIITMSMSTLPCQRDQNNTRRVCVADAYSLHHHHTHTHKTHAHVRQINLPYLLVSTEKAQS